MASSVQLRTDFYRFCCDTKDHIVNSVKPVIDRLINWAKEFFIYLGVIRPPAYHLEPRQSQFVEQFKLHPEHYRRQPQARLELPILPGQHRRQSVPSTIQVKKHDDYLEEMKLFAHEFSQVFSKCIFEKHGPKLIEMSRRAPPDLPEKLRSLIYWVYGLGDKQNKPLFKKIRENKNLLNWSPDMKNFLTWAKGGSSGDLFLQLTKELPSKIQLSDIPKGHQLEEYTNSVLAVLFNVEASTMGDLYKNHSLEPHLLEKVFEAAVLALFDKKVNAILAKLNEAIQDRLPEIIKQMLQVNVVKIADLLASRIADLVQNIGEEQPGIGNANYMKMIDAIMGKINEQALAFLDAQYKANSPQVDANFLKTFRETDICHDMIRGKILPISPDQNISIEEYHKKLDNIIYSIITENFLELLFPSKEKTIDGRTQKVDGVHGILEHIELPPLFYELFSDVKRIATEITTPDTMDLVGKIMEPLESLFDKFLLSNVQGMIFDGTRSAFSNMVRLLSDCDQLDAFVGEKILPVLNHRLVCTFTSETIRHHLPEFAPFFKSLITENDRGESLEKLIRFLYDKVKKGMVQFDLAKEVPYEQFKISVLYIVEEIENMLRYEKASPVRSHQAMDVPEITALMKSYYTSYYKADNPLYAQLVMNAVFKIGNFGKFTEKLLGFSSLQTLISTAIVSGMKRIRTSPRQLIVNCLKIAQKRFGTEEEIMKILTTKRVEIPEGEQPAILEAKKRNMEVQMEKASRLVYDLVTANLTRSVAGGNLVAIGVLGKDASHLKKVMETCYRKFFGNAILSQNLLYQIQDVIVGTFRESALRVKLRE